MGGTMKIRRGRPMKSLAAVIKNRIGLERSKVSGCN